MLRSFTDRVFGGVCGGLAASLRVSGWLVRLLFVGLTLASVGVFAVPYLLLWWVVPQESLALARQGRFPLLFALLLLILAGAAWVARVQGYAQTADGADLVLPGAALLLAVVFFLRQLR